MDWNRREYYALALDHRFHDMIMSSLKLMKETFRIKIKPYKRNIPKQHDEADVRGNFQYMISVPIEHSNFFEYELLHYQKMSGLNHFEKVRREINKYRFHIGDQCEYILVNDFNEVLVHLKIEIVKFVNKDVRRFKIIEVLKDNSGNGYYQYIKKANKEENGSIKYMHKLNKTKISSATSRYVITNIVIDTMKSKKNKAMITYSGHTYHFGKVEFKKSLLLSEFCLMIEKEKDYDKPIHIFLNNTTVSFKDIDNNIEIKSPLSEIRNFTNIYPILKLFANLKYDYCADGNLRVILNKYL